MRKNNLLLIIRNRFLLLLAIVVMLFISLGMVYYVPGSVSEIQDVNPVFPDDDEGFEKKFETFSRMFLSDTNDVITSDTLGVDSTGSVVDSARIDSIALAIADSIRIADSIAADTLTRIDSMAFDSTARLRHFTHRRKDLPYLSFSPKRKSSFFAQIPPSTYKRTVELDTSGAKVIIKETLDKKEYKPRLEMPVEEYIELRRKAINRQLWEELGYQYELKSSTKDLGELISDITNIDIPLPPTSFLSIFGPPRINLQISGAVDIHGAWRSETTEGISSSRLGNTRNEPDFKQQVQINVSGTIGDKLTISADWNTERTFEYENQLKIKYTGYEDEIIQSIEAGNVSLQTSSLVGGSEALFGIKAQFQMGPFSLTALASQKKGEVQEVSVSGGAESQEFEVHAYDYSTNHFFLHEDYANPDINIFNNYYGNATPVIDEQYRVKDLEVWKTTTAIAGADDNRANAFIDLDSRPNGILYGDTYRDITQESIAGERLINDRFIQLTEGVDYTYQPETGYITFKTQIQDNEAIAVAFRQEGPTGSENDIFYGEFVSDVTDQGTGFVKVLKLVKPKNLQPDFEKAWKLQLRNIYPIGGRDIKEEGFVLDIKYSLDGQDPVSELKGKKLVNIFGLDNTDQSGTSPTPDGAFDYIPQRTINPSTGELIFPVLQPFGDDFPETLQGDYPDYASIYTKTLTFAKQDRENDKFIITGEYSASVSSTYSIGFNVVENSVKVLLNGNELREGSDYSVDYNIGQITIRNDAALVPGADLRITYEQNDLFQLASKTLLGFRGMYDFSKKTKLGFSFLNLNQQTLSDKVRIGEEPLNNSIFGLDFQTAVDMPFLTKGLDNLISTKTMSSLSLKGEFAYMSPDPNTKKSNITSDGGKSIAYIDDFEGAKRIIPIGISDRAWKDATPPVDTAGILTPNDVMGYKAKSFWFNELPSTISVEDIWGDRKQTARDDQQVTVLDFIYRPNEVGRYNWYPTIENPRDNWGGMMKPLSSTANNLVEENIEFIEFWLFVGDAPEGAKLKIDLGQISEDLIPNNTLDTEDKNQNDLEEEGEDTGIDGLFNSEEPGYDPVNNTDPSGDDFYLDLGANNYERINGSEGNAAFRNAGIKLPDTEDMNRNFTLDRINSYFTYEVPLDTNILDNEYIIGGGIGLQDWYQFRIPLKDYVSTEGSPSLSVVEAIRVWIKDVDQDVYLRFAEMNLVGNQWQKVIIPGFVEEEDTVLTVGTINFEDNPYYTSPPGVVRERDRSKPDEEVLKNEQSLELIVNDLPDGDKREVVKYLYRPLDLFNYKEMKMFIHGDLDESPGSVSNYVDATNYAAEVYFRFGTDSLNFYEYRQPVQADWNEIGMVFEELTAIKQIRDTAGIYFSLPVDDKPGHSYGVLGNPTLTKVTYFTIGIVNPKGIGATDEYVSGNIWINELRVLDAEDTPGWAYSASTSFKVADLLTVNANMSRTDPYFHKLADRFGSRVDRTSWGASFDLDMIKLIPANIQGSSLKLNYSHTESVSEPLYLPGTDILVEEAMNQTKQKLINNENYTPEEAEREVQQIKTETQTLNISDSWSLSNIRFKIPSNAWYIQDIINSLSFGFNYSEKSSRNPTTRKSENWLWNANANYALTFGKENYFYPANIPVLGYLFRIFEDYKNVKVYFSPQNFNSAVTAKRSWSYNLSRTTNSEPNIQRDFQSTRNFSFLWKFTEGGFINLDLNYSADFASQLTYLLTRQIGEDYFDRKESEIWSDIFGGDYFGRDFSFKQNFDLKTKPQLPSLWNINKYFNVNAGYSVSYNWNNNFTQEELGRSAGFSSRLSAGLSLRLKSLMDPLFAESGSKGGGAPPPKRQRGRRGRDREDPKEDPIPKPGQSPVDSTQSVPADTSSGKPSIFWRGLDFMKLAAKYILFDYEQITLNFSQQNSLSGGGILGEGTGFSNFWGIAEDYAKGPTRGFMLGLDYDLGPRAPNGNLTDNFSQKNSIDFKTSRPLWEGATIDLNWKVAWGINKTTKFTTDSLGNLTITSIGSTGSIDRSFLSIPIGFLGGGIKGVSELYDPDAANPTQSLSDAFSEGFESVPIFSRIPFLGEFAKYVPRPNWRISWNGLEKFSIFKGFAKRVSLNHVYSSGYTEGWKIDPDGNRAIQTQRLNYGFSPLLGLNITFEQLWKGNLTASVKYSTKTSYDLGISTRNITESLQKDINITASYSKSGFEIPFFGVSLKNDLEISFSYTSGRNSVLIFEMDNFDEEGKPQDGTIRTSMEPRIKYVMSSRVTLSLFYKMTSVEPEGAARIPPTTTNEAGLDVHISIR